MGRAARRGRDDAKIGENAIPARPTDNPLISLETAKEKVCKSLEKFGISLEFPWKSLEILGKAWRRGGRLSRWRMRRRARPEAPSENRRDNFFPKIEIRAMVNRQRPRRLFPGRPPGGRARAEIGEDAIPA